MDAHEAHDALAATRNRILDPITIATMHRTNQTLDIDHLADLSPAISSPTQPTGNTTISVLLKKAVKCYETENYQKAYDTIVRAVAIQDDNWDAYALLVNILAEAGKENAIPDELRSLENRESLPAPIWALIGGGYEAAGDLTKADDFAGQALALDKSCSHAWNLRGTIEYRKGNRENATQHFLKAIHCDAEWGDPWTNLGTLYWERGNHKKALDCFEQGIRLSPTAPNVATTYHIAVAEAGQYERAEPLFEEIVARHPNFRRVHFMLIDILIRLGRYSTALERIESVLVRFGTEEQLLQAAKVIRAKVGLKKINNARTLPFRCA